MGTVIYSGLDYVGDITFRTSIVLTRRGGKLPYNVYEKAYPPDLSVYAKEIPGLTSVKLPILMIQENKP